MRSSTLIDIINSKIDAVQFVCMEIRNRGLDEKNGLMDWIVKGRGQLPTCLILPDERIPSMVGGQRQYVIFSKLFAACGLVP